MARNSIWSAEETLGRQQYIEGILRRNQSYIHMETLASTIGLICDEPLPENARGKNFHNSSYRRTLSRDIDALNWNPDFRMQIISNSKGVKIATEKEEMTWEQKERREAIKKLAKCAVLARKAGRDGQTVLVTAEEIEAFAEA